MGRQERKNLVSEARPIPLANLSPFERGRIQAINERMHAIIEDAREHHVSEPGNWKKAESRIEGHRTGRVLLIDGGRGTGKTSLLLTLLRHWRHEDPKERSAHTLSWPPKDALEVFLPVLDFDPLPPGMPLHGWLLQPWREVVDTSTGADEDLSEAWAELFDQAVIGWGASVDGKTMVDRALGYQDQASGWYRLQQRWRSFVNQAICHRLGCAAQGGCGRRDHGRVFVVPIDDVDLQVERLSELLHAIRLLHHPNVAYILTGNYRHMSLVTELDYVREHARGLSGIRGAEADRLWADVMGESKTLRVARLEKALPLHARFELRELMLEELLELRAEDGPDASSVAMLLDDADGLGKWLKALVESDSKTARSDASPDRPDAETHDASRLKVITVRSAQHAIDRYRARKERVGSHAAWVFAADLGDGKVNLDALERRISVCEMRGELTTLRGRPFTTWEARGGLEVALARDVRFAVRVDGGLRDGADAHRALLLQLVLEHGQRPSGPNLRAPWFDWRPDAGIIWTRHPWSHSDAFPRDAIFHWPWLVRPSAYDVLKLVGDWSEQLRGNTRDSKAWTKDDEGVLTKWIELNFKKNYAAAFEALIKGTDRALSMDSMLNALISVRNDLEAAAARETDESNKMDSLNAVRTLEEWVLSLAVMTTPHFGLTDGTRRKLWNALKPFELAGEAVREDTLVKQYVETVRNAIIWAHVEQSAGPSISARLETELPDAVRKFTEEFLRASTADGKWWKDLE